MPSLPITIGELTDVPAFDSPIASPWAQEVSRRIAHRFPTVAARNAAYPAATAGAGALCVVATTAPATLALYVSDGAGWIVILEPPRTITAQPGGTARWGNDASLPLIFSAGSLPSSALVDAAFQRCGQLCQITLHVNTGAAGGFGLPIFNLPFLALPGILGQDAFNVGYTNPGGSPFVGSLFTVGNQYATATLVAPAGGGAVTLAGTSATAPFPPAANSQLHVNGTYLTTLAGSYG